MRIAICLIWLIFSTISFSQFNSWEQVANFGGINRLHAVSFTIGNYAYVGLGNDGSNFLSDFWKYDTQSNIWTPIANFIGSARDRAVAFSLNGKGYVGLGLDNNGYKNDFYEFNPATNSWTQIVDFPGTPRIGATAFSLTNMGYVGSGSDITSDRNDFYQYNPLTNSWIQIANFPGGNRRFGVSFSINNFAYFGTGLNSNILYSDFWKYDPSSNSWVQMNSLPGVPRAGASSFSIGNSGYIGTGGFPYLQDFWEYNSIQNLWIQRSNFIGSARELGVGFSVNGFGYIGTGYSTINTNDIFKYIPDCDVFDSTIYVENCDSFVFENQTYNESGLYTFLYYTPNGCDSIISINLTINTVDTTVSKSGFTLTANQASASYQWYNCTTNTPINGATSQSYTATSPGWYSVLVTANGCSQMSECKQIKKLNSNVNFGMNDLFEITENRFLVYPNPFSNSINISSESQESFEIRITDIRGREVFKSENETEIPLEFLEAGMYQLTILYNETIEFHQIVKL